jgi:hydroxymethylpyrimidine pyrophosphatase-like HAD family hydrolase
MEKIFLFSDIDDTLIQTKRKTDFSKTTIVGAYNKEGEENSFFYEGTKRFIDKLLEANITFIPTTARNLESYKRTIFYKHNKINMFNIKNTLRNIM